MSLQLVFSHKVPRGWVSWAAWAPDSDHVTAPLVAMHWWLLTRQKEAASPRPRPRSRRTLVLPLGRYPGHRAMLPEAMQWVAAAELARREAA